MDELDKQSLHELRNAVNTACLALDVGLTLLEKNQADRALVYFKEAKLACDACRPLLLDENAAPVGADRKLA